MTARKTQLCEDCAHWEAGICKRFKLKMGKRAPRCAAGFKPKQEKQEELT